MGNSMIRCGNAGRANFKLMVILVATVVLLGAGAFGARDARRPAAMKRDLEAGRAG